MIIYRKHWVYWGVLAVLAAPFCAFGQAELKDCPEDPGWLCLFNGTGFDGWRTPLGDWRLAGSVRLDPEDPARFEIEDGEGLMVNGETGRTSHMVSKMEHADVEAHIEFMVPKGSNSGVYFMGRYEIQVFDSYGVEEPKYLDCGAIYQRWDDKTQTGYEGHPPKVNASRAPGEWQSFHVFFTAPRFDEAGNKVENAKFVRVIHNGVVVQENVEVTGPTRAAMFQDEQPTGPLMLQGDHGPVAYRNIRIHPLNLR
jgi:hypothetical protein